MARTGRVLLASACCMLAASVAVAVIAIVFHPSKSEAARLVAELRPQIQCALCSANLENDETKCEKCERPKSIIEPLDCSLTRGREKYLTELVKKEMNDRTTERHKETLEKASVTKETRSSVIEQISNLNLNVARPFAHWHLKQDKTRQSENDKKTLRDQDGTALRNVSGWVSRSHTNTSSQYGIESSDPHMKITEPGWYHVYFQLDIHCNVQDQRRYKIVLLAASGIDATEKKTLLTREETSARGHKQRISRRAHLPGHLNAHSRVVLKGWGTFKLLKNDLLRIEVDMPIEASINNHMSKSFFGALYLRHFGEFVQK